MRLTLASTLILAAFGAGVIVGRGSAPRDSEGDFAAPSVEVVAPVAAGRDEAPILGGHGDATAGDRAPVPHAPRRHTDLDDGAPTESRRGAALEVLVTDARGRPVQAQVFAFPRDAGEWDEAPMGWQEGAGPCSLRVPRAGRYDVFARTLTPPGLAGREEVTVEEGETVRLHLAYAEGRPITFEREDPWPLGEMLGTRTEEGSVSISARRAAGWRVEGRGLGVALETRVRLWPADGPWASAPLPPGVDYDIQVLLSPGPDRTPGEDMRSAYYVVAEPATARAGESVRLRVRRMARVGLHVRTADSTAWPEGPVRLRLRLEQDGGVRDFSHTWRTRDAFLDPNKPARILTVARGPARVTWDGPGIAPGVIEGLVLDPDGTPLEQTAWLETDPAELPSRDPLRVTIEGLPPPPYADSEGLELAALLPSDDEDYPTVLTESDDPRGEFELDHGWRRAGHVVAWLGTRYASEAVAMPRTQAIRVTLRRAGLLVVVPDRILDEELDLTRIRRVDGHPFLVGPGGGVPVLRHSAIVWAGDRVGPLPAGRHAFEVTRGGRRLADAVVEVHPDRVGVLRIQ